MTKAASGFVAFGATAFISILFIVFLVVANRPRTPSGPAPDPRSPLQKLVEPTLDPGERPVDRICTHRWWSKRPSPAAVEKLANMIVQANRGDVIWFDRKGTTIHKLRSTMPSTDPGYDTNVFHDPLQLQPDAMPDRGCWSIYVGGDRRRTRSEALAMWINALDAAEYKYGPG